jgi:hypothetical protein
MRVRIRRFSSVELGATQQSRKTERVEVNDRKSQGQGRAVGDAPRSMRAAHGLSRSRSANVPLAQFHKPHPYPLPLLPGQRISMKDFHFFRFTSGKIVEHWNQVAVVWMLRAAHPLRFPKGGHRERKSKSPGDHSGLKLPDAARPTLAGTGRCLSISTLLSPGRPSSEWRNARSFDSAQRFSFANR